MTTCRLFCALQVSYHLCCVFYPKYVLFRLEEFRRYILQSWFLSTHNVRSAMIDSITLFLFFGWGVTIVFCAAGSLMMIKTWLKYKTWVILIGYIHNHEQDTFLDRTTKFVSTFTSFSQLTDLLLLHQPLWMIWLKIDYWVNSVF